MKGVLALTQILLVSHISCNIVDQMELVIEEALKEYPMAYEAAGIIKDSLQGSADRNSINTVLQDSSELGADGDLTAKTRIREVLDEVGGLELKRPAPTKLGRKEPNFDYKATQASTPNTLRGSQVSTTPMVANNIGKTKGAATLSMQPTQPSQPPLQSPPSPHNSIAGTTWREPGMNSGSSNATNSTLGIRSAIMGQSRKDHPSPSAPQTIHNSKSRSLFSIKSWSLGPKAYFVLGIISLIFLGIPIAIFLHARNTM